MRKSVIVSLVLIALLALGIAIINEVYFSGSNFKFQPPSEKIAIQAARYNSTDNSIYIYLQSLNGNQVNLTSAIVKDDDGKTVTTISTSDTVNGYNRENYPYPVQTLVVHLNSNLPASSYAVTLVTKAGDSFASPSFTIP
jgi:hypothetical protein